MRSNYIFTLALTLLVGAAPLQKKTASKADATVLQFAFVLEQLETQFYQEALKKFQASDFLSAGFTSAEVAVEQFQIIQSDESTHASVLQQTIIDNGLEPLTSCQFDFSSALTDVATMAATARVVELVGVGAYLGAANLIDDPQLLTAAASILTVEARHSSLLNIMSGAGVAIPDAFDLPLSPPQVLALAGPFISNCDLGIQGNTPLKITNTGSVGIGTSLTFDMSSLGSNVDSSGLSCQMLLGGSPFAIVQPVSNCIVPQISGPVAIFITNTQQPLLNSQVNQLSSSIVMGPTMAFIDSQAQTIGQLVRSGGGTADSSSTISPSEASSIQASATATGSVSEASSPPSSSSSSEASSSESGSSSSSDPASSQGSATASASSAAASTGASANVAVQQPGGPNFATGPSGDGHTVVQGWQNLPPGISPPS